MGLEIRSSARRCLAIIAISLLAASSVLGQVAEPASQAPSTPGNTAGQQQTSQSPDPAKQPFLRTFARDEWTMWTSPFRRSSYDSHTVKKYVIPFAMISAALIGTDTKTADLLPNTSDQAKWSGRVSQIGASYSLAGMCGITYLVGELTKDKHAREAGWLGLEAIAHTQLVVFTIKQVTNRQRPLQGEGGGGFWDGGDSFPSGHAATSFAVAAVFAYEYRDHIAVPITAYTLASLVSASRLSARKHWISDIFVGGSVGFLIGRFVYKRHHDPTLPGSPVNRTSRLVPDVGFGGGRVQLAWRF